MRRSAARADTRSGLPPQPATSSLPTSPSGAAAPTPARHPFDLMLGSLGACTAITLRMYGERKQWNLGTIEVKLRLIKEGDEPCGSNGKFR